MSGGPEPIAEQEGRRVGRYALHKPIAAGGMAIVHLGRLLSAVGFSRTVAIKRVHPNFAHDREFVAMFVDEAHLAARIHHPNVVATLDVIDEGDEMLLVMEYIHGEALSRLIARSKDKPLPLRVCSAILTGVLHGLHAAHEAKSAQGEPLNLVHRDVSPQNILVGADGLARVVDFGIAKAVGRLHTTGEGKVKGKLAYMSPEQILAGPVTRRSDVHAAAIVAWEMVTGRPLFRADNEGAIVQKILEGNIDPPSRIAEGVPAALDALIMKGLDRDPDGRFATAREMALALESCVPPALPSEVARVVEQLASESLCERAAAIATMERTPAEAWSGPSEIADVPARPPEEPTRSQLAVFLGSGPKRGAKGKRVWFGAALGVGFAAIALTAVLIVRKSDGDRAPVESTASPPPSASATPLPETSPAAQAAPSEIVPAGATSAAAAPKPRTGGSGARPKKPKGCDPPYTLDPTGKKTYKRNCF